MNHHTLQSVNDLLQHLRVACTMLAPVQCVSHNLPCPSVIFTLKCLCIAKFVLSTVYAGLQTSLVWRSKPACLARQVLCHTHLASLLESVACDDDETLLCVKFYCYHHFYSGSLQV